VVFIHNGVHSFTKKNEILFAGGLMELENIILSEVSQVQKPTIFLFQEFKELHLGRYVSILEMINSEIVIRMRINISNSRVHNGMV
jgi:hypothetical protein